MTVTSREAERIKSKATPRELASAIGALDLTNMTAEQRKGAIAERLAQVMLATTTDPVERSKAHFQAASATHNQRNKALSSSLIV